MTATPYGVIAALCPVTNPTSTALYKALLALRTKNGIILCPHPNARVCTTLAANIVAAAAEKAGAPRNLIGVLSEPSKEGVAEVMRESDLVWATGGAEMVEAAKRSGRPSLLGGPGNAPALIDELANVENAVTSILLSKTFDNGMICAAEQTVVVVEEVFDSVVAMFKKQGVIFPNIFCKIIIFWFRWCFSLRGRDLEACQCHES